jgi:hypothetical protein
MRALVYRRPGPIGLAKLMTAQFYAPAVLVIIQVWLSGRKQGVRTLKPVHHVPYDRNSIQAAP